MSTLVGHFVLSLRERDKIDRRDKTKDEREGQRRKKNRNESEETEEIKTFPLYKNSKPCQTVSQYQLDGNSVIKRLWCIRQFPDRQLVLNLSVSIPLMK